MGAFKLASDRNKGSGIGGTSAFDMMQKAKMTGAQMRAQEAWKKYVQETKAWEGDMADYGSEAGTANLAGNVGIMALMAAIPGLGMAIPAAGAAGIPTIGANLVSGAMQAKGGQFAGELLGDAFVGDAPTPPPEFGGGGDLGFWGRKAFEPYQLSAAGDQEKFQNIAANVGKENEEMANLFAMMNFMSSSGGGGADILKNLLGWTV